MAHGNKSSLCMVITRNYLRFPPPRLTADGERPTLKDRGPGRDQTGDIFHATGTTSSKLMNINDWKDRKVLNNANNDDVSTYASIPIEIRASSM
jgi:hypothetical protein